GGGGEYCGACRVMSSGKRHSCQPDCDHPGRAGGVRRPPPRGATRARAVCEAALAAAQHAAEVTAVEPEGAGGACVLHDCVPSKTFIASSDVVTAYRDTEEFGVRSGGLSGG